MSLWISENRRAIITHSLLFVLWHPLPAYGQDHQSPRIDDVRITGNRRIPEGTIHFYIQTKKGDPYNESQILRDYRNLLNTNFFEDARVLAQKSDTGMILIFEVKERPLIRSITYQGLKSLKESDVLERFRDLRVGLTVDSPLDEARLPKARRAIRMLLDQNGRPLGRVELEVEPVSSSSVKLVFKVDEGPKVRIGRIDFEGNTVFSDAELHEVLKLDKERGLFTVFKGQDKYIEDKLAYDLQVNLLAKYRERGYIMARAGEPKVEMVEAPRGWLIGFRKTKTQYQITISIQEGDQYRYGSFEIEGIKNFNSGGTRAAYHIVPGEVVNYTQLKKANDDLKKLYARFGYLDMDAIPEIKPDPKTKTVDVSVRVEEGRQFIVNRINFAGSTKTRDKVLRREFLLQEQQVFNGQLLDLSILRLNQLGYFERIEEKDYDVVKKSDQAEVDVLVKVKERSAQSIGLSGGVSGISGNFAGITYSDNNFRGTGQRVDVQFLAGTRTSQYRFAFTDPYFRDTPMSLGFSVFQQRLRFDTFSSFFGLGPSGNNLELFSQNTTGFTLSGSYPIWRWTRLGLSYSFQSIRINDVDDRFRDFAFSQLVGFTPGGSFDDARRGLRRSEVTPSFVYSTKDRPFAARRGTELNIQVPVTGGLLGGTFNIIRPTVEFQHFRPDPFLSPGRNTFAFRVQFMHLRPFGKLPSGDPMAAPFFERIFSGGEFTLRGFDLRSVSPMAIVRTPRKDAAGNPIVDPATGLASISENFVPVGGDTSLIATAEYRIPVIGPLQVTPFVDVGTSTILEGSKLRIFGPDSSIDVLSNTNDVYRVSTGAEVQFLLPVINQPFRLIFSYNPLILDTDIVVGGVKFPLKEPRTSVRFTVGYSF